MSSLRALRCLPSVKKQKRDFNFFFRSMYNKTIIRFGFCDIQNNRGLGKGYQPTSNSIILDITKTASNNCLLSESEEEAEESTNHTARNRAL